MDVVICNDLALEFNGVMVDEADGERQKPTLGKYRTYQSWCEMMTTSWLDVRNHNPAYTPDTTNDVLQSQLRPMNELAPPDFRFDVDKVMPALVS